MSQPTLPPFEYQPRPYTGPSAEEVLRMRREFLNPALFIISGAGFGWVAA